MQGLGLAIAQFQFWISFLILHRHQPGPQEFFPDQNISIQDARNNNHLQKMPDTLRNFL